MAIYVYSTTKAFSAGSDGKIPNTPTLHASTNITISTSNLFTATFTAPNLVNAVTGCFLYIVAPGTVGQNITVTLQDNTVDTTATATLSTTNIVANSWNYFSFGTPYTYASLAAGRYRFKVVASGSGSHTGAADSGAANLAFMAIDNQTATPGANDDIIVGSPNLGSVVTTTLDGTQSFGSGASTTITTSQRTFGAAISVLYNGKIVCDTAANTTITCKGSVIQYSGGEFSPAPGTKIFSFSYDENGTGGNFGMLTCPGGKFKPQGASRTYDRTTLVSGVGTAASPLVVTDSVDWAVGDEIIISATSNNATNYNESESRFIITKNSATSYVVSTTSGGAEAAFTYSHAAGARIYNVQHSVIFKTTNSSHGWYWNNQNVTSGNVDLDFVRLETVGAAITDKTGLMMLIGSTGTIMMDNICVYRPMYRGIYLQSSTIQETYTKVIVCQQNSSTDNVSPIDVTSYVANKTFTNFVSIGNNRLGVFCTTANCTWNNLYINACGSASTTYGGLALNSCFNNTFNNIEINACRVRGLWLYNSDLNTWIGGSVGTTGTHGTSDIYIYPASFVGAYFDATSFGSSQLVNNYTSALSGTNIRFNKLNNTVNNHLTYYNTGIVRSTGASLADTTVRTAGTLNLRFAPEDATTGIVYEYLVLARASSYVQASGFLYCNAAFVSASDSSITVDLYLPGSTTPDATKTMTETATASSSDAVFALASYYNGTVPAYARVRITVKTATAAAYVYLADIFNGTNDITNLKTWYQGLPSPIMFEQLGDSQAVWNVLTSTMTTDGTAGKMLVDTNTKTDDNQALIIGM